MRASLIYNPFDVKMGFREFYRGQPLFTEVISFLAARGFHLCALGAATPLG